MRFPPPVVYLVRCLILTAAWIALGIVGMWCYARFAGVTPVWPASGLGLAALLLWGPRYWPAIALGSLSVSLLTLTPAKAALILAAANTVETAGAAWLLRRLRFQSALSQSRDVLLLALVSAPFSTLSAALGIGTFIATGLVSSEEWAQKIAVWFFGNFLGVLLLAPPLLVWAHKHARSGITRRNFLESLLLLTALAFVTVELFFKPPESAVMRAPMAFLTFPFVAIAGMRHGLRGGTLATLLVAALAVLSTAQGMGVFVTKNQHDSTLLLMMFEGMLVLTALFIGAASMDQRRRAAELLQHERMFQGLADANQQLLASSSWADAAPQVLATLSGASRVDRASIYRLTRNAQNQLVTDAMCRWNAPDDPAISLPPMAHGFDFTAEGVAHWAEMLQGGRTFTAVRPDLPQTEAAILQRLGIVSLVIAPILVEGRSWGFLGLADCSQPRRWSADELAVFGSIATNIGIAIRRDQLRSELSASFTRYQALLSAMPDAYFLHDRNGAVIDYHTSNPSYLWLPIEKFLGRPMHEFFPADAADLIMHGFAEVAANGRPVVLEYSIETQPGTIRHFERRIVRAEGGNFLCVVRDMTRERQADIEHSRIEQKLREAQKLESLGVLAGGIAHDFNNLLTAILGNAGLARSVLKSESEAVPMLSQIELAAHRAADLCRQMLAYAGRSEFVVECADLTALVRDTVPLLQLSVSQRARLEFDLAGPPLPIFADVTQLRQVLMNLTLNSAEAMGPSGGTITLRTGTMHADAAYLATTHSADDARPGEYRYLEVADTGCGMSPATLAHIFDPFFTTKFTGRGLGLAAVLGIVRGHHGALRVTSTPGEGTTFRILLPPLNRENNPGSALPPPEKNGSAAPHRREGLVLVVDDEEDVRITAGKMLEHLGYRVTVVADGASAVTAYAAAPQAYKFVLLDLTMPGMDGSQTLAELQRRHPEVVAIAMSGYSEKETSRRLKGHRIRGFLPKPFNFASLIERLDRAGV